MSADRTIVHKTILVGGLTLSAATLPFSIKICHAAIIILVFGWIIEGQWREKIAVIQHSLLLQVIIALFFLQVLGLAFADDFARGWFSLEKKVFFFLIPVALATTPIKLSRREIKLVIGGFLAACFIGTLVCLVNAWQQTNLVTAGEGVVNYHLSSSDYPILHALRSEKWLLFSYVSLSEGISIHPTYFSLFLVFNIIFLVTEFAHLKSLLLKTGALVLIFYFAIFAVFLASRIAILGLFFIFIFLLIRTIGHKQKYFSLMTMAVVFVFCFLLFLNPVSRYRSLQEINTSVFDIQPGNNYTNSGQIRVSLWWLAAKSLTNVNLVSGTGTGDVEKMMARTGKQYRVTNIINSFDPHNQYLYTLLGHGYPGFFLLILCLGLPVYFAWVQKDYMLLGFSCLFILLCFTESALELQKGIVFYSLFSALLFFQFHSFQCVSINLKSLLRGGH